MICYGTFTASHWQSYRYCDLMSLSLQMFTSGHIEQFKVLWTSYDLTLTMDVLHQVLMVLVGTSSNRVIVRFKSYSNSHSLTRYTNSHILTPTPTFLHQLPHQLPQSYTNSYSLTPTPTPTPQDLQQLPQLLNSVTVEMLNPRLLAWLELDVLPFCYKSNPGKPSPNQLAVDGVLSNQVAVNGSADISQPISSSLPRLAVVVEWCCKMVNLIESMSKVTLYAL